jgi:hypothetical protein
LYSPNIIQYHRSFNPILDLRTLNPRDYARWSSRSLARFIFGEEHPGIYAFADFKETFRPRRVREALDDDLGVATVKSERQEYAGDGMDVDEELFMSKDPPPQHLLDDLHLQVLEHFGILLTELLRRVAPPSLFAQNTSSGGTALSIYASSVMTKPAREWEANDILSYLCNERRLPRDSAPEDVAAVTRSNSRLIDFFTRKYHGRGRSGRHWARADWMECFSKLGALGRMFKDGAILNSLVQLEPQMDLIFSMRMVPTGTGAFGA